MSTLMRLSCESNMNSARTLASWVLPTPVGPRKRNVPIGLFGFLRPALLRLIALTIFSTASSWPMIFFLSVSPIERSLLLSDMAIRFTGMPVISEMTDEMSSAVISMAVLASAAFHFFNSVAYLFSTIFSVRWISPALGKSLSLMASLFSILISSRAFSSSSIFLGMLRFLTWARAPASSIASIALSGRHLSVIYLVDSDIQAFSASSV